MAGSLVLSAGAGGRKNQLLLEVEGNRAGMTWDQEEPNVLLLRPADRPPQLVVRDPALNAPSARPLSRYPAGHAEGYGGAFRNLFEAVYGEISGSAGTFPRFTDGHHGVALVEASLASARNGGWEAVSA